MLIPLRPALLPHWIDATLGSASGSLLGKFWLACPAMLLGLVNDSIGTYTAHRNHTGYGEPRLAWQVAVGRRLTDSATVTATVSGLSVACRSARSAYDFFVSRDPIWHPISGGSIALRNLERVEVTRTPDASGLITLEPLVPDADIALRTGYLWEPLRLESGNIDTTTGVVILDRLLPTQINYASARLAALWSLSGSVYINADPSRNIFPIDLIGLWDTLATLSDLTRFPGENSIALANRVTAAWGAPALVDAYNSTQGIARRLDCVDYQTWDTSGILTFPASSQVYSAVVETVDKEITVTETISTSGGRFYLSRMPESASLRIAVNGSIVFPSTVSGAVVTLPDVTQGQADFTYRVQQYAEVRNAAGDILALTPLDLSPALYRVWYTRGPHTYGLRRWNKAYTPENTPTTLLKELVLQEQRGLAQTLGFAHWQAARWFAETEQRPDMFVLPQLLDAA